MVEISEEAIQRMHEILAGIKDADKKVLKPVLTRGLSAGKTEFRRQITSVYDITPTALSTYANIRYKSVSMEGDRVIGSIQYGGGVIPLYKFNVTPRQPAYGKTAVKASVKKESGQTVFDNAFVAQMETGHKGIFERKGKWQMKTRKSSQNTKNNEKIKELFGPSAPKMAENAEVFQSVEERVNEVISKRMDHEIMRVLNKYGGGQ